ncbi:hypothetical protein ACWEVF_09380 [Staphylococcus xylosus]|uniref:hypothetical protein n=1 Tax=Staphylococcus xylosus TaxID=1288 RepID=UPI002174D954|nr:hypothetical protein [Staphylococcus xylosus]
MEFAYYETKSLNDFENELKTLALNKNTNSVRTLKSLKKMKSLKNQVAMSVNY